MQAVEAAIDPASDRVEFVLIRERDQPIHRPEPRGRLGGILRQLRSAQKSFVAEQRQVAAQVIVVAGNLGQAATAIALAITIRCRRFAQFRSQVAGVVFAQVLIATQLPDVLLLTRLVTNLRQKRGLAFRGVDLPMGYGCVEGGYKNARLAAGGMMLCSCCSVIDINTPGIKKPLSGGDGMGYRYSLAVRPLNRTRLGQLGLTPLDPHLNDLLAIEGLTFLINCVPIPIDPYLSRVSRRIVLAHA